jgi:hypothetical protein
MRKVCADGDLPCHARSEVLVVPRYRCFCLTEDDRVAWGLRLDARSLEAAIAAAHRACEDHLKTSSSRVEIWRGAKKLHVSSKAKD